MIQMNLFTKQKQAHRLKEWVHGYQWGRVGRRECLGSLGLVCAHCYI